MKECLLTRLRVDRLADDVVVLMARVKNSCFCWIPQASCVVPRVPDIQHVMEVRHGSCHRRPLRALGVASKVPEGTRVVHEDDVRKLAGPIALQARLRMRVVYHFL